MQHLVHSYLAEERIREQGIFDYPVVKMLVDNHLQKKADTSWMLWNLIVFEYWYEKYGA